LSGKLPKNGYLGVFHTPKYPFFGLSLTEVRKS